MGESLQTDGGQALQSKGGQAPKKHRSYKENIAVCSIYAKH